MSLQSSGVAISITLKKSNLIKVGSCDEPLLPMEAIRVYTKNCSIDGQRKAFIQAMIAFANTEHFAACVHGLSTETNLCIQTSVDTAMPR